MTVIRLFGLPDGLLRHIEMGVDYITSDILE